MTRGPPAGAPSGPVGDALPLALDEQQVPLRQVLEMKVADTVMLNATPDSLVELRAGQIPLTRGRMGRRNSHIAIRVEAPLTPHAKQAVQKA